MTYCAITFKLCFSDLAALEQEIIRYRRTRKQSGSGEDTSMFLLRYSIAIDLYESHSNPSTQTEPFLTTLHSQATTFNFFQSSKFISILFALPRGYFIPGKSHYFHHPPGDFWFLTFPLQVTKIALNLYIWGSSNWSVFCPQSNHQPGSQSNEDSLNGNP